MTNSHPGGVLSDKEILERLFVAQDLIVHPILNLGQQMGSASLDIRLGRFFLSQRTTSLIQVDPLAPTHQIELDIVKVTDHFTLDTTEAFVLHPGRFALGCTFEYIKIPDNLIARLEGRSSWARIGLQVHATAGYIDSGFEGMITFELSNVSEMPVQLYPLLRIGQLSFISLGSNALFPYGTKSQSKYQGELKPSGSKWYRDGEWSVIRHQYQFDRKRRVPIRPVILPPNTWGDL